jgi:hypothetical protein
MSTPYPCLFPRCGCLGYTEIPQIWDLKPMSSQSSTRRIFCVPGTTGPRPMPSADRCNWPQWKVNCQGSTAITAVIEHIALRPIVIVPAVEMAVISGAISQDPLSTTIFWIGTVYVTAITAARKARPSKQAPVLVISSRSLH